MRKNAVFKSCSHIVSPLPAFTSRQFPFAIELRSALPSTAASSRLCRARGTSSVEMRRTVWIVSSCARRSERAVSWTLFDCLGNRLMSQVIAIETRPRLAQFIVHFARDANLSSRGRVANKRARAEAGRATREVVLRVPAFGAFLASRIADARTHEARQAMLST